MTSTADLFSPVVAASKLHPQFVSLRDYYLYEKSRALMNALFGRMGNPNGHFVRDFQTHGFHAGVFELACFAYLEEAGLEVDRSHERPDFLVSRHGSRVAVESVTANPPAGRSIDVSLREMVQLSEAEIFEKVQPRGSGADRPEPQEEDRAGLSGSASLPGHSPGLHDRPVFRGGG